MRFPLYFILVLLALPLVVTGWYAERSLGRFQQELAQLLLERHLSEDLRETTSPLESGDLARLIARQEPAIWALWLGIDGKMRGSNHETPPQDEAAIELLKGAQEAPETAPKRSPQGQWVLALAPLDERGRPGEWIAYLQGSDDFGERLALFHWVFWGMALFGALAAGLVAWYYWARVQRPLELILKKDRIYAERGRVQEAQIDPSLIGRHDLGEVMTSRNKLLEQSFLHSARQEIMLNSLHDALFVFSPEQKIVKINFAAAMLVGKSEGELKGLKAKDLATTPDQPWLEHWWNNYQFSSEHPTFEAELKSIDGEAIPVLCSAELLISPTGQFDGMLLVCRDLSQAKALQAEVNLLSLVAEQSPVGLLVMDLDGVVDQVNLAYEQICQLSQSDLRGEPWRLLESSEVDPVFREELRQALSERHGWAGEVQFVRGHGPVWQRLLLMPVKDEAGEVLRFALLVEDITEAKRLELALKEANRGLEKKVEERVAELKEAKDELERANEELKSLDRLKDDFLAVVSHELRTPLAAIIGYAETMIDLDIDRAQQEKFLKIILGEGERLSLLIAEVLDLSALSAGKLNFTFVETDLDSLLQEGLSTLEGLAIEREITLEYLPSQLKVMLDRDRMLQLLINLVGNALKFSPARSKVEVSSRLEEEAPFWRLEVRDHGSGIPEDALEKIFDRFQQIENQVTHRKGTGLGLTLARKIVEAHGGQIWAENREPGALFICRLPLHWEGMHHV